MRKTPEAYLEYLESDHWHNLRKVVLDRDGRKCTRCKSRLRLQAHHKFYRMRWEDSEPDDLITLCRLCHQKEHGLITPEPEIKPKLTFKFMHEVQSARAAKLITRQEFNQWKKHFKSNGWVKSEKRPKRKRFRARKVSIKPFAIYRYNPPSKKWINRGTSSN